MDRALTVFIWIWAGLVVVANVVGVAGVVLGAGSFWAAVGRIQEIYSPFNLWTYGLNVVLLSPALGAYLWRERRRRI